MIGTHELIVLPMRNTDLFLVKRKIGKNNYQELYVTWAQLKILLAGGGGVQIQSDWAQSNNTLADFIKNKPNGIPVKGGMYVEKVYTSSIGNTFGGTNIAFIQTVNKLYVVYATALVILDSDTGVVTNTLPIANLCNVAYSPSRNEMFCFTTVGTMFRVSVTPGAGTESIILPSISGFGTNTANTPNAYLEISPTKAYVTNNSTNPSVVTHFNPSTLSFIGNVTFVGALQQQNITINSNPLSIQNGKVIVANQALSRGISVIDEATNTINVNDNNFSSLLSGVTDVKYIPTIDRYLVLSGLNHRFVVLSPATANTFNVVFVSQGFSRSGDVIVDETNNLIFVGATINGNLNVFVYDLITFKQVYTLSTGFTTVGGVPKMQIDIPARVLYISSSTTPVPIPIIKY